MAQLYDARFWAHGANGNPLALATLTVYLANTTTPADIWRDAALTVPMTNPTSGADVSDAGGWFPQVFAAEGLVVDILVKDSGGSTIKTYTDVTFVGTDSTNVIEKDFTNARVKISGTGGIVDFEAGPAVGDDTGGAWRVGGWAGTRAETGELDAAAITVTGALKVSGALTEGGNRVNTTVSGGTHTVATNLDIPIPATGRGFVLEIFDVVMSTTAALFGRVSTDNAASFLSTTIYDSTTMVVSSTSATFGGGAGGAAAYISASNVSTTSGAQSSGQIEIFVPASGTRRSRLFVRFDTAATWVESTCEINAGARPTHIRIYASAGTFSCVWRLRERKD